MILIKCSFFYKNERAKAEFKIKKCSRKYWELFRKYHYLNKELSNASECYGLFDNNKIIGFISIIHYPNKLNKNIKKVHRLVILPEYQGIGLGIKFLNIIAKIYINKGFDFFITTSLKNLVYVLKKHKNWKLNRKARGKINENMKESLKRSIAHKRFTFTFKFYL